MKLYAVLTDYTTQIDNIYSASKLLPYVAGKVKPIENVERDHIDITINLIPYKEGEFA
jgi:hypothetical protein